jgi:hypothetical protein
MQKSFIERIFPHSSTSVLPRYQDDAPRPATPKSPPRIQLRDSSSSPRSSESPSVVRSSLQAAPLSASIIHHEDPFLQVDRAAKALQRTIQSYLDAQSDGLTANLTGNGGEDMSSVGSPTPTPSVASPSRSASMPKTIPVRQPAPKKISLRGARRGLGKAMDEFAQLRSEELAVISSELSTRQLALKKSKRYQDKRSTLLSNIQSIHSTSSETSAHTLRKEADVVKREIQEVESRLFELRSRYRQLVTQADQLDNSLDSKLSSYKSSLALVEKDMKQFLRQPPVSHSLPMFDNLNPSQGGMYALKPERRTLEMAEEQWTAEQELLSHRRADVESEREALQEGVKIWQAAIARIAEFEKSLRRALRGSKDLTDSTSPDLVHDALLEQLNALISSLQADLATAENNSWNLLICCLGAEIEALEQGRVLLGGASPPDEEADAPARQNGDHAEDSNNLSRQSTADDPPPDLLNGTGADSPGGESNRSLKDTLEAFGDGSVPDIRHRSGKSIDKGKGKALDEVYDRSDEVFETPPAQRARDVDMREKTQEHRRDESEGEDDDPGPAFLLSHS